MAIGQETTVDGIERLSSTGIRVLIIGAGVAGLGAALECWRKGCEVTVLERNAEPSSAGENNPRPRNHEIEASRDAEHASGDFFTLPPSALANVKYYPRMVDEYNSQVFNCTTSLWSPSGKLLFTRYPEWRRDKPAHPAPTLDVSFLNMRSKWAKMQLNQLQRCGVPVNFGQTVESVHESQDQVIVRTKDGKEYSCDVCMLANGVATKMPGFETEGAMHVVDSGYAAARVAFPRTAIKKDSPAYDIVKDVPEHPDFRVYVGSDVHLILFLTADHVGWVFTHKVRPFTSTFLESMTDASSERRHRSRVLEHSSSS